jgi:hypothetical protein
MVAYLIRRSDDDCAVIKLHPDNREEVVQDGLTLIEAEILCEMRIGDIPRAAVPRAIEPGAPESKLKRPNARQLKLVF